MNIGVIFAGGVGSRMRSEGKPKQFLELHGKPILIHTLEHFEHSEKIDGIILVMLESWIPYTQRLLERFQITKVRAVIAGGSSGQESIFFGLRETAELFPEDSVVLLHDGVRPLIDEKTLERCIDCVEKNGNAITVSPAIETVALMSEDGCVGKILPRSECQIAKAPQCFRLRDIYASHCKARAEGRVDFIDSASMMQYYGYKLHTVEGSVENIKITTPADFYIFRAIIDARENSQVFGL